MTLSNESRDRVKHAFQPIALAMGRAGLTPDTLTLIGFAITVAGAVLLATQQWLLGGIVVFLGGAFDMFDGTLARATGKVSAFGAFMDSVFDRWGEGIVYLGIVVGSVASDLNEAAILAVAAMGAAFMVSYTRAKSEGLGFTFDTGMAAVGVMPREVRLVILCLGLVAAGVLGTLPYFLDNAGHIAFPPGAYVISLALAIIIVGSTITTIQRIIHVRYQARQQSSSQPTENET